MVLARVEDEDIRTAVFGIVVVEPRWQEDVAGLLAGWHSCLPAVEGPEILLIDEVGDLCAGLASSIVQDSPVVVTPVDLDWLHNLIWGISENNFYGVKAYSVVDFLRLRMESARTARVMEKFPGLNEVKTML